MAGKKIRNPLIKRLPREFIGEWKKYLVVFIFLVAIIASVSGMYVANRSMLNAAEEGIEKYKREDGNFELKERASEELIAGIENGENADLLSVFEEKGKEELDKDFDEKFKEEFDKNFDEEVEKNVRESVKDLDLTEEQIEKTVSDSIEEARASEDYKKAYDEAYGEAYDEALNEVNEEVKKEYNKAVKKFELDKNNEAVKGVQIYENFFEDLSEDGDKKIRIFKLQDEVNIPSVFDGTLPTDKNSIAIDRMHADNAGLKIGDMINVNGRDLKITALIALPNYSTLYSDNSDTMFDAIHFDVGVVVPELFDELTDEGIRYSYAWRYETRPADEEEENALSERFLKVVITQVLADDNSLEDYLPSYLNQAINFATDDFSKDLGMVGVFMDIFMIVIAFIFGVTISSTIAKESKVIGTLRASGYTRGELIRHYISVPIIITILAAIVGNILGYTCFKDIVASMYYNSYSLPTFKVVWSTEAFYKTTLIPFAIMFLVNLIVITYKL
ncbi:MAG: FtsX-like permease family protein, partial [Clostridiales bacterium]|nr:FtsX-like permease family protein [Clostridiales bacterium]